MTQELLPLIYGKKLRINSLASEDDGSYLFYTQGTSSNLFSILKSKLIIKDGQIIYSSNFSLTLDKIYDFDEIIAFKNENNCYYETYGNLRSDLVNLNTLNGNYEKLIGTIKSCPEFESNEILLFALISFIYISGSYNEIAIYIEKYKNEKLFSTFKNHVLQVDRFISIEYNDKVKFHVFKYNYNDGTYSSGYEVLRKNQNKIIEFDTIEKANEFCISNLIIMLHGTNKDLKEGWDLILLPNNEIKKIQNEVLIEFKFLKNANVFLFNCWSSFIENNFENIGAIICIDFEIGHNEIGVMTNAVLESTKLKENELIYKSIELHMFALTIISGDLRYFPKKNI